MIKSCILCHVTEDLQKELVRLTWLYIADVLKREDVATIAKLNDASSMFSLLRQYGPKVLELIEA